MINIELNSVENTNSSFHSINANDNKNKLEQGSAPGNDSSNNSPTARIGFNKAYLFAGFREGLIRAVLIIALTGGWIAAACIPKDRARFDNDNNSDLKSAQIAYLVLILMTYISSIIFFLLNITNIINLPILKIVPWHLLIIVFDGIGLLGCVSVSIAAAVIETNLNNNPIRYIVVNQGAFAAAAFFGFFGTICLVVLVAIRALKMKAERFTLRPNK